MDDNEYNDIITRLRKYEPLLQKLIQELQTALKDEQDVYLQRLKALLDLITCKGRRASVTFLTRSEVTLELLYRKYKQILDVEIEPEKQNLKSLNGLQKTANVKPSVSAQRRRASKRNETVKSEECNKPNENIANENPIYISSDEEVPSNLNESKSVKSNVSDNTAGISTFSNSVVTKVEPPFHDTSDISETAVLNILDIQSSQISTTTDDVMTTTISEQSKIIPVSIQRADPNTQPPCASVKSSHLNVMEKVVEVITLDSAEENLSSMSVCNLQGQNQEINSENLVTDPLGTGILLSADESLNFKTNPVDSTTASPTSLSKDCDERGCTNSMCLDQTTTAPMKYIELTSRPTSDKGQNLINNYTNLAAKNTTSDELLEKIYEQLALPPINPVPSETNINYATVQEKSESVTLSKDIPPIPTIDSNLLCENQEEEDEGKLPATSVKIVKHVQFHPEVRTEEGLIKESLNDGCGLNEKGNAEGKHKDTSDSEDEEATKPRPGRRRKRIREESDSEFDYEVEKEEVGESTESDYEDDDDETESESEPDESTTRKQSQVSQKRRHDLVMKDIISEVTKANIGEDVKSTILYMLDKFVVNVFQQRVNVVEILEKHLPSEHVEKIESIINSKDVKSYSRIIQMSPRHLDEGGDFSKENRHLKRCARELQDLKKNIKDIFISRDVLTAKGRRKCSVKAEVQTRMQIQLYDGVNKLGDRKAVNKVKGSDDDDDDLPLAVLKKRELRSGNDNDNDSIKSGNQVSNRDVPLEDFWSDEEEEEPPLPRTRRSRQIISLQKMSMPNYDSPQRKKRRGRPPKRLRDLYILEKDLQMSDPDSWDNTAAFAKKDQLTEDYIQSQLQKHNIDVVCRVNLKRLTAKELADYGIAEVPYYDDEGVNRIDTTGTPITDTLLGIQAETELQINQTKRTPVLRILKPWIKFTTSQKSAELCKKMLDPERLSELFKCMGDNCVFSTDVTASMEEHIKAHEGRHYVYNHFSSYLECSYCNLLFPTGDHLVPHIEATHKIGEFQCSKCFYRGALQADLDDHQNSCHRLVTVAAPKPIVEDTPDNSLAIEAAPLEPEPSPALSPFSGFSESPITTEADSNENGLRTYNCTKCSFSVQNPHIYNYHIRHAHWSENHAATTDQDISLENTIESSQTLQPLPSPPNAFMSPLTVQTSPVINEVIPQMNASLISPTFFQNKISPAKESMHSTPFNKSLSFLKLPSMPCLSSPGGGDSMMTCDNSMSQFNLMEDNDEDEEAHIIKINNDLQLSSLEKELNIPKYVDSEALFVCNRKECSAVSLKSAEFLQVHLEINHAFVKMHNCTFCGIKVRNFVEHLLLHSKHIYKCSKCSYIHHSYKHVGTHMYMKHGDKTQSIMILTRGDGGGVQKVDFLKFKNEQIWKCNLCHLTNNLYDYTAKHIMLCHATQNIYECSYCDFRCKGKYRLINHHQSNHPKLEIDKCRVSSRPVINFWHQNVEKIFRRLRGDAPTVETPNDSLSVSRTSLTESVENTEKKKLEGELKQETSNSYAPYAPLDADNLNQNDDKKDFISDKALQNLNSASNYQNIVFTCQYCIQFFGDIHAILSHWKNAHGPALPFQFSISKKFHCTYCDMESSFDYLKDHHIKTHANLPFKIGENVYENLTNLRMSSADVIRDSLLDQIRIGRVSKSWKCDKCNIILKDCQLLDRHYEQEHKSTTEIHFHTYKEKSKLYGCTLCDIFFLDETYIIEHFWEHLKTYICLHCQSPFRKHPVLLRHYRVQHQKAEFVYIYPNIRSEYCIDYFKKNCVILFPNGLLLGKGELTNTKFGGVENLCRTIESAAERELKGWSERQREMKRIKQRALKKASSGGTKITLKLSKMKPPPRIIEPKPTVKFPQQISQIQNTQIKRAASPDEEDWDECAAMLSQPQIKRSNSPSNWDSTTSQTKYSNRTAFKPSNSPDGSDDDWDRSSTNNSPVHRSEHNYSGKSSNQFKPTFTAPNNDSWDEPSQPVKATVQTPKPANNDDDWDEPGESISPSKTSVNENESGWSPPIKSSDDWDAPAQTKNNWNKPTASNDDWGASGKNENNWGKPSFNNKPSYQTSYQKPFRKPFQQSMDNSNDNWAQSTNQRYQCSLYGKPSVPVAQNNDDWDSPSGKSPQSSHQAKAYWTPSKENEMSSNSNSKDDDNWDEPSTQLPQSQISSVTNNESSWDEPTRITPSEKVTGQSTIPSEDNWDESSDQAVKPAPTQTSPCKSGVEEWDDPPKSPQKTVDTGDDWGASSTPDNNWKQPAKSEDDWGQSTKTDGDDWGQSNKSGDDWGQSTKSGDDWGQSNKSGDDWGQSNKSGDSWGKPSRGGGRGSFPRRRPFQRRGGFTKPGRTDDDWGQSSKSTSDWGQTAGNDETSDDWGQTTKSENDWGKSNSYGQSSGRGSYPRRRPFQRRGGGFSKPGRTGNEWGQNANSEDDWSQSGKSDDWNQSTKGEDDWGKSATTDSWENSSTRGSFPRKRPFQRRGSFARSTSGDEWKQPKKDSWGQSATTSTDDNWDQPAKADDSWQKPSTANDDWDTPANNTDKPSTNTDDWDKPEKSSNDWDKPSKSSDDWEKPAKASDDVGQSAKSNDDWDNVATGNDDWNKPTKGNDDAVKLSSSNDDWDKPADSGNKNDDWGQPAKSSDDWGQPAKSSDDWGQPAKSSDDWGQPAKSSDDWENISDGNSFGQRPSRGSFQNRRPSNRRGGRGFTRGGRGGRGGSNYGNSIQNESSIGNDDWDKPADSGNKNDDWGQPAKSSDDWGQPTKSSDDWGQPAKSSDDWGQPAKSSDDWGQPAKSSDDWGQPAKSSNDWGQPAKSSDDWENISDGNSFGQRPSRGSFQNRRPSNRRGGRGFTRGGRGGRGGSNYGNSIQNESSIGNDDWNKPTKGNDDAVKLSSSNDDWDKPADSGNKNDDWGQPAKSSDDWGQPAKSSDDWGKPAKSSDDWGQPAKSSDDWGQPAKSSDDWENMSDGNSFGQRPSRGSFQNRRPSNRRGGRGFTRGGRGGRGGSNYGNSIQNESSAKPSSDNEDNWDEPANPSVNLATKTNDDWGDGAVKNCDNLNKSVKSVEDDWDDTPGKSQDNVASASDWGDSAPAKGSVDWGETPANKVDEWDKPSEKKDDWGTSSKNDDDWGTSSKNDDDWGTSSKNDDDWGTSSKTDDDWGTQSKSDSWGQRSNRGSYPRKRPFNRRGGGFSRGGDNWGTSADEADGKENADNNDWGNSNKNNDDWGQSSKDGDDWGGTPSNISNRGRGRGRGRRPFRRGGFTRSGQTDQDWGESTKSDDGDSSISEDTWAKPSYRGGFTRKQSFTRNDSDGSQQRSGGFNNPFKKPRQQLEEEEELGSLPPIPRFQGKDGDDWDAVPTNQSEEPSNATDDWNSDKPAKVVTDWDDDTPLSESTNDCGSKPNAPSPVKDWDDEPCSSHEAPSASKVADWGETNSDETKEWEDDSQSVNKNASPNKKPSLKRPVKDWDRPEPAEEIDCWISRKRPGKADNRPPPNTADFDWFAPCLSPLKCDETDNDDGDDDEWDQVQVRRPEPLQVAPVTLETEEDVEQLLLLRAQNRKRSSTPEDGEISE